jgi:hypothetical protein
MLTVYWNTGAGRTGTLWLAMLEQFTIDTFTPLTGQVFKASVEGMAPLELVLESVNEISVSGWRPDDAAEHRKPFSMVFVGPPQLVLPQAIYRFEHETVGAFEIFIVPIGRNAEGVRYEVVFS